MKKIKLMPIALIAALSVSLSACGASKEVSETEQAPAVQTASEAIAAAVEAAQQGDNGVLLEKDLGSNEGVDLEQYQDIYTFILDGKEYHLSGSTKDLFEDGWVFSNEDITMDGTDVVTLNEALKRGTTFDAIETPDYTLYKTVDGETRKMMVGIYSDTNQMKTLNEFHIGYLYVREDAGIPLEMITGITFGSTIEEVKEFYGDPVSESSGVMSYMFTEGDVAMMPDRPEFLNFYVNEGKVYMISMQYFPVLSK